MKNAMHKQERNLIFEGSPVPAIARVLRCIACRNRWSNHDVTEEIWKPSHSRTAREGSWTSTIGEAPGLLILCVDREGEHVSGSRLPHELFIKRRDRWFAHEEQRELSRTMNSFSLKYIIRKHTPAIDVDRHLFLLISDVDLWSRGFRTA
jgi:hypothetical protein